MNDDEGDESEEQGGNTAPKSFVLDSGTEEAIQHLQEVVLKENKMLNPARKAIVANAEVSAPIELMKSQFKPSFSRKNLQDVIPVSALVNEVFNLEPQMMALGSPSIAADLATISSTTRQPSESSSVSSDTTDSDVSTDLDEIRSSESRIHDKLIWDDGKWYREQTYQLSAIIADYIFWRAKETGELTDASDEEIAIATALSTAFIIGILSGNFGLFLSVLLGTGGFSSKMLQAGRERSDRRNLDEKFGK